MNIIECPYCKEENEVEISEIWHTNESDIHKCECQQCKKMFVFTVQTLHYFKITPADCLNEGAHLFVPLGKAFEVGGQTHEQWTCSVCGFQKTRLTLKTEK